MAPKLFEMKRLSSRSSRCHAELSGRFSLCDCMSTAFRIDLFSADELRSECGACLTDHGLISSNTPHCWPSLLLWEL